jgi:alpha-mannosidase
VVLDDRSNTWSHGVYRYDQEAGAFAATRVRRLTNGPLRATVRVESAYGRSRLVQDFTLHRDLDRLDVTVTVDWHEQFKMLKLRFPVNVTEATATYEIPYGTLTRPTTGLEEVGQTWADLTGATADQETYGLSLLNDAKYAYSVQGSELSLTVLRSPIYASLLAVPAGTEDDYAFMDQGVQTFRYTLLPHAGGWQTAGTVRAAAELNAPPLVAAATFHAGGLPRRAAFIEVEADNVVLNAVKLAEDGSGDLILRAYNPTEAADEAIIHLNAWRRGIQSEFGPAEVKTLRVPLSLAHPAAETNLLEELPDA